MKILSTHQTNQPSFRQINLVQIPKKAFPSPNDATQCTLDFYNTLLECTNKKPSKLSNFLSKLGLSKHAAKYSVVQESPTYMLGKRLQKEYGYSVEYFEQNTKIPFKKPLKEDMFSYFILTKNHHREVCKMQTKSYSKKLLDNAMQEYLKLEKEGKYPSEFVPAAIATKELDKDLDKIIAQDTVYKFELNSVNELENIIKELDI